MEKLKKARGRKLKKNLKKRLSGMPKKVLTQSGTKAKLKKSGMPGNGWNRTVKIMESPSNTHLVCISSRTMIARRGKSVSGHTMETSFLKNHSQIA